MRNALPLLACGLALGLAACDSGPVLFPPPSSLDLLAVEAGAEPLRGTVGEPLSPPPEIRVVDGNGNPVPGARVRLSILEGSGVVSQRDLTADRLGRLSLEPWTLGERTGRYRLGLQVTGYGEVEFSSNQQPELQVEAFADPGGPDRLVQLDTVALVAPVDSAVVDEAFRIRVEDRFQNPVPGVEVRFRVVEGGGSLEVVTRVTDEDGVVAVPEWILGPEEGINLVEASVPAAPNASEGALVLEAYGMRETPPWWVEAVHVNQGNQSLKGTVPLVAGRDGLLRVFLQGFQSSPPGVRVRVQLRRLETVLLDEVVARSDGGRIDTFDPVMNDASTSWNLPISGSLLRPGTEVRVQVDPDGILRREIIFPGRGEWAPLEVLALPTFRATFLPIHATFWDLTGRITPENVMGYAGETVNSFPIGEFDFQVRTEPLVYDGSFENRLQGWIGVLQDVRDLRLAEGAMGRYYHGILQRPPGAGLAGIAYVATQPLGIQNLAAVSFDQFPQAPGVIAHEFGHNFGRNHAPCGISGEVDQNFPYPDGSLGDAPGFSPADGELRSSITFRDVMSYCRPAWASDYTFRGILEMRTQRQVGAPEMMAPWGEVGVPVSTPSGAAGRALLVGGGWSDAGPFLRPAITVDAPASIRTRGGEARVTVLDALGRVLAEGRYMATSVDHADDPSLRTFGAVISLPDDGVPAEVRLETPLGAVALSSPGAGRPIQPQLPEPSIQLQVERVPGAGWQSGRGLRDPGMPPGGAVLSSSQGSFGPDERSGSASADGLRVRWNVEEWPVLVARSPHTGRIVGFLRSGDVRVPVAPDTGGELVLEFSDGVRSRVQAVEVP